ncbi:MAG: DNA-directed RNA polymerase subunit omega [Ruminococcaceae bacterium]|nr:DNA-directed RNA polymerase subunit omega [Oscillospiraceae bacterium]MBR3597175.1 DNA-directed RNA polymerase subunit omega [Clostridia bacterium]
MINIDMKPLLKGGISRYSLVVGVAKRSREIADEANDRNEKLVDKTVSLAVDELLEGKFTINEPDDAHKI